jgi:hypothetical protein
MLMQQQRMQHDGRQMPQQESHGSSSSSGRSRVPEALAQILAAVAPTGSCKARHRLGRPRQHLPVAAGSGRLGALLTQQLLLVLLAVRMVCGLTLPVLLVLRVLAEIVAALVERAVLVRVC